MTLRNPFTRLVLTARRLARERKGAGAIEFAILFPVLIMLYIGAFEITIGLSVSKRVTRAAGSIADIVTQQQSVTKTVLAQMPSVATSIFVPYNSTSLTLKVTGITVDAGTNAKVLWSWAQDGTAPYAKNTAVSDVP
ncbi:TadE/TadG family type IV pilus assembly protein, partial [Bradyrhizobium sp. Lot11]